MEYSHVDCVIFFKCASGNGKRRCAVTSVSRRGNSSPRRCFRSRDGQYTRREIILPALSCNRAKFPKCTCITSNQFARKLFVCFPIIMCIFYSVRISNQTRIIAAVRIFVNALRIRLIRRIVCRIVNYVAIRTVAKSFPISARIVRFIAYVFPFAGNNNVFFLRRREFRIEEQARHHRRNRSRFIQILTVVVCNDLIIARAFDGKGYVRALACYRRFYQCRAVMFVQRFRAIITIAIESRCLYTAV